MVAPPNKELHLEDPLLQKENCELYAGDGSIDLQGKHVLKSKTGNWTACTFILVHECCQCLAFFGVGRNLVSYLTGKLHEGNSSAARHLATWTGTCYLSTLIGAFLADSYWGRYWTIAVFSSIYFLGMGTLTLSVSVPAFIPAECVGSICPSATSAQNAVFFLGLYLIALGTGGIKPCIPSFGADQFDDTDPIERMKKGSFFNWFYVSINIGSFLSSTLIVYIQENVGWGIGFGIPALFSGFSIVSLFAPTPLYRFQRPGGSPITRICQVLVASWHKCILQVPEDSSLLYETPNKHSAIERNRKLEHTEGLRCLDKASVLSVEEREVGDFSNRWRLCTVTQVEELKILIRMFPVWATGVVFTAVYSQTTTTFIEQGMVMDRRVGSFTIPAASLSVFCVITVIICVPVYDKILVPIARKFTRKERGLSELHRIGIGLFFSMLGMVAAALVETKRLQLAKEMDLADENVAVLNIMWQIPQFLLMGISEVFAYIGQLEFFCDQAPDAMRSLCSALYFLTISMGNYLNSLILTIVTSITTADNEPGWIPDNLNKGQLDSFFWLLAGLNFLSILVYVVCAKMYKEKTLAAL